MKLSFPIWVKAMIVFLQICIGKSFLLWNVRLSIIFWSGVIGYWLKKIDMCLLSPPWILISSSYGNPPKPQVISWIGGMILSSFCGPDCGNCILHAMDTSGSIIMIMHTAWINTTRTYNYKYSGYFLKMCSRVSKMSTRTYIEILPDNLKLSLFCVAKKHCKAE